MSTEVYHHDFHQWIQATIQHIQQGSIESLDWNNLIEELQGLGNEQKNQLESRLQVLYEHLLKLAYWSQERDYNQRGWGATILEQRKQLKRLLKRNPSLVPYIQEVNQEIYEDARQITSAKTGLAVDTFPSFPMANMEDILNEDWLPDFDNG